MDCVDLELGRILELIKETRWFAQKHAAVSSLDVCDIADFSPPSGASCLWILLRVEPGGQVYSLTIESYRNTGFKLISPETFLEYIKAKKSLSTRRGGRVRFVGPSDIAASHYAALDESDSSNTVLQTTFGKAPCVAKFFRKMDGAGGREVETLLCLQASGITPKIYAQVSYQSAFFDCANHTLAIFMEFIEGDPAFRPFQLAVRQALDGVIAGSKLEDVLSTPKHLNPDVCDLIGEGVAAFHNAALSSYTAASPLPRVSLQSRADAIVEKWNALLALKRTSSSLSGLISDTFLDDLHIAIGCLHREAISKGGNLDACYGHGDLHLSHIILVGLHTRCRIIDPANSTAKFCPSNHSAMDLFQIYRGLEYFAFDEAATRLEAEENWTREAASECLAGGGEKHSAHGGPLKSFALAWPDRIFERITQAYLKTAKDTLVEPLHDPLWSQLFYLDRLLNEIKYNIDYDRLFFRFCDWMYLQKFAKKTIHRDRF